MSSKGKNQLAEYDATTVDEEQLATHREAACVPHLAGTHMIAIRHITEAKDQIARQALDPKPAKK